MNENSDKSRFLNRYKALKDMIKSEFSDGQIEFDENETLISVSKGSSIAGKERNPRVVFHPDEAFMSDLDSDEKIFRAGIQIAKQILENPPFKNRNFQGEIHLRHEGAAFEKRTT